jgi:cytochrome c2
MHRAAAPLALLALLAPLAFAAPACAADPDAGARVFKSQCATCHAVAPGRNLTGPTLAGIIGRKAGTVPGFRYSAANKQADVTWDDKTLDTYLVDPKAMIPGTSMLYAGLKSETQRADLIAYLDTLK